MSQLRPTAHMDGEDGSMTESTRRMSCWLPIVAHALLSALLCSCDARKPAVPAPTPNPKPMRIVSLAPSITEILFAIGAGSRIVGVTKYCDYPVEACALPKIGGYYDPSIEAIATLNPDLAILFEYQSGVPEKLAVMNIPMCKVNGKTMADVYASIATVGKACGQEKESEELLRSMRARVRAVRARRDNALTKPKVMIAVGHAMGNAAINDTYIVGADGFYDIMLDDVGAVNACQEQTAAFPKVSKEGMIEMDPDIIIDLCSDLEKQNITREEVLEQWRKMTDIKAVREKRVYVLTDDFATIPGPRFPMLLEKLADTIHPSRRSEIDE